MAREPYDRTNGSIIIGLGSLQVSLKMVECMFGRDLSLHVTTFASA
jgi:hypothetical protein